LVQSGSLDELIAALLFMHAIPRALLQAIHWMEAVWFRQNPQALLEMLRSAARLLTGSEVPLSADPFQIEFAYRIRDSLRGQMPFQMEWLPALYSVLSNRLAQLEDIIHSVDHWDWVDDGLQHGS